MCCRNGLGFVSAEGANLMEFLDGSNTPGEAFRNGFGAVVGVLLGWNGLAAVVGVLLDWKEFAATVGVLLG